MPDQKKLNDKSVSSMNDIYIILPEGNIAYLPYDLYSEESRIVEKVNTDGKFIKRFFLNEEGVYPANLAGPAVTKVIPWNIEHASTPPEKDYNTGYFIDLRQLKMSRLNMIKISDDIPEKEDTPIANNVLPITKNTFIPVPKDKQSQLKAVPNSQSLYIAFFQNPDKTHSSSECYSYCVSYISEEEVKKHIINYNSAAIEHLKTYYGDTQVQSGSINPNDFNLKDTDNMGYPNIVGLTCYVANLKTFQS